MKSGAALIRFTGLVRPPGDEAGQGFAHGPRQQWQPISQHRPAIAIRLVGWVSVVVLIVSAACAQQPAPLFKLYDPGTEEIVDYERYGEYRNIGLRTFGYVITNFAGLVKASGEGIDPCLSITNNPEFRKARDAGKLKGDWWKYVNTKDPQQDYFVWAAAPEDPGVRLLFVGKALEKAGHLTHALKAYRAAMILYADSACWSSGAEFQWDVATSAWNAILNLLRKHPELGLRLVGADVVTKVEPAGLAIMVTPGHFERVTARTLAIEAEIAATNFGVSGPVFTGRVDEVIAQRGTGTVQLVQYGNGDWRMLVAGEPYFIRGMCYAPTMVGVKPWEWNWLWSDENTNGVVDSYEVWVDANKNGAQDPDEPTLPDYQLLKEMGCNTIKLYITPAELVNFNYLLMRKMFHDYGIRVIVGNFLGAYCNDSGADWDRGTDYTNKRQKENMRASVSNLVMKLRGEPWVLAWVLGNENNMEKSGDVNATRTNASEYPETFARFLDEVALMIHGLDPHHPVGIGNLLTGMVEYYGRLSPNIDWLGINSYIGEDGFGATWQKVRQKMNRPVVITEFGCDAYHTGEGPNEDEQSRYVMKNWEDIVYNSAGHPGAGNAIGGFVFEWLDEWWKDSLNYFEDPVNRQTARAVFPMPFPDGQAQEEWFGVMSQGAGNHSPFQRVPRKLYYDLQKAWIAEQVASSTTNQATVVGAEGKEAVATEEQ